MSAAAQNHANPPSQFAGALVDILDRVEYRRVSPEALDDPIYRLRYEAYRREEFYPANSHGTLTDEFDVPDPKSRSWNFGVYIDGGLVSSIRIHHLTAEYPKSPANSLFNDILQPMLDDGASFIDPTRFAVDLEASLAYPALPFLTLRLTVLAARYFDTSHGVHCVRPEHGPFYKRVWGAKKLCEARRWHDVGFPMELWGTNIAENYERTVRRYPFFHSTDEERRALFRPPYSTPVLVHASTRAEREAETSIS